MPITIKETPGASDANSYESLTEFTTYLGLRLRLPASITALLAADPTEQLPKALIMATRGIDAILTRYRRLEILEGKAGMTRFYVTRPYWTGTPTTTTQALAWPRTGMYDRNGNAIASTVIPQPLKDAVSEFAIIALTSDLLADNQVVVQGLTGIKAGPIDLQFKDFIQTRALPTAVQLSLVPSWFTDELFENVPLAQFGTLGSRGC